MKGNKIGMKAILLTIAAVAQIILTVILYDPQKNVPLINLGWLVMMLSAIFGWLPIFTFRRRGKVEGKAYVHTTVLVDSGVYSIVRHPQYLAGVLMSIALPLISQHWSIALLGLVAAVLYYLDTFVEEEQDIEKFGEEYRQYMQKVPRLNFILGIIRVIGGVLTQKS